ncbi:MAG: hypothetical protein ABSD31_14360 [Candidatus Binataceae bacterium]
MTDDQRNGLPLAYSSANAIFRTGSLGVLPFGAFGVLGTPPLPVTWILAIVCFGECGDLTLLAPDLFAGPSGMVPEVSVPFFNVPIDRRLRIIECLVVAVVNNRPSHAAEDGFNHIEELGP